MPAVRKAYEVINRSKREQIDLEFIQILGVKVHLLDISVLHQKIAEAIFSDDRLLVLNTNVHCLNLAYRYKWLNVFLNDAQIVFCDGFGVRVGARILGYHLPQRITYADWTWQLAKVLVEQPKVHLQLNIRVLLRSL